MLSLKYTAGVGERPCLLELYNLLYKLETGAWARLPTAALHRTVPLCTLYYLAREILIKDHAMHDKSAVIFCTEKYKKQYNRNF